MRILLWGLQSSINIGMILRTAEIYQVSVSIYDQHRILKRPDSLRTISDFACGALQRQPPTLHQEPEEAWRDTAPHAVSTSITPTATAVQLFRFTPDDCLLLGNEYDGLPDWITTGSRAAVHVPMPPGYLPKPASFSPIDPDRHTTVAKDGMPNLNVAVAASIVLFQAWLQLG